MLRDTTERLLTPAEAADLLRVPRRSLDDLSRGGGPRFVRLARRVCYRACDLQAWIEAGLRRTTREPGPAVSP